MSLLLIILLVFPVLILLAFTIATKIIFTFNSDKSNMNLTLLWLYPFIKAVVTNEENRLILTVYLFKKSIFRKALKGRKQKSNNLELIKQVNPTDVTVNTSYGFRDPFVTGIACGAINIAAQFIDIDSISQNPDFVTDRDYIYVNATAKVKLGSALVNMYKAHNTEPGK